MRIKSNSDLLPEFIVIAGPNGAGKSTTSKNILTPFGIQAFDWDKEFHAKWKKFNFDPIVTDGIRESVNDDFQKHINTAFLANSSVAYETTFHSSYNLQLANEARGLGYRNSLYFLALSKVSIGIRRVAERVRKGGHNVSKSTIRERFEMGLGMLDKEAINFFDRIFIYNSAETFILQFVIENKKLIYKSENSEATIVNNLPNLNYLFKLT